VASFLKKPWVTGVVLVAVLAYLWLDERGEQAPREPSVGEARGEDPQVDRGKPEPAPNARPKVGTEKYGSIGHGKPDEPGRDPYRAATMTGAWESPEGLRYTRGSREGHRLKHVLRHGKDQPSRPGKHGVFEGNDQDILRLVDEAYRNARAGGRGVRIKEERGRTIYDVDMRRRIGFVGGRVGAERGHPACRSVRLVLEGRDVVSAYPI